MGWLRSLIVLTGRAVLTTALLLLGLAVLVVVLWALVAYLQPSLGPLEIRT